ncbi:MAG: HDOD domain-containing protein [Treponema sp.]|jgi:putative nucleotidyltransferase with HDIG domain|nr:HDOD domain-containing protein [Treponema sp.]
MGAALDLLGGSDWFQDNFIQALIYLLFVNKFKIEKRLRVQIMTSAPELTVDEGKIKKAIQSGLPLTITTYTLPREIEVYIEQIIDVFLKQMNQMKLKDYIVYCVQELVINAKKANTKRVYFTERGLDINDREDYEQGMANFKDDSLNNLAYYLQLQKERGLYIRVVLQVKRNTINIEIRNNVTITRIERLRIHDKMARSRQYNSLEDALSLSYVPDDAEGAGLGLIIMVLMLKKIGLDDTAFSIKSTDKYTTAGISIPLDQTIVENMSVLSNEIAENIDSLPQFPENVMVVQRLIEDPSSDMPAIARQISTDPALTADLLKVVNSAQYMLSRKVDSISEAVKMVGIKGVKNLLYSYGTQKVLGDDTIDKKNLWEHSYRTAFYAYSLAKNFKNDNNLLDDAYAGGILHDIGKIIISNVHPDLLENIKAFCAEKNIPASTFVNLSANMNHAELGALVAEKWNFPDRLAAAIRYHHDPSAAPAKFRDVVDTVYLANMFCEYENNNVSFDQFEDGPLENFGLDSKNHIDILLERLASGFKRESQI